MKKNDIARFLGPAALLIAGIVWTAPVAAAQEPAAAAAPAVELPSAQEVIARHAKAVNAKAILGKVKSFRMKGTLELVGMGIEGTLEAIAMKPNKGLTRVEMAGIGEVVDGYIDGVAFGIHPMMGPSLKDDVELLQAMVGADFGTAMMNVRSPKLYESMKTVGKETFDGRDCFKVACVARPLEGMDPDETEEFRTTYDYFDAETGLLAGQEGIAISATGEAEFTIVFSEYKRFGEGLFATKISMEVPGVELAITADVIEFDVVEPEEFELPQAIQTLIERKKAKEAAAKEKASGTR
ncbi:MAG: hypothetical protein O7B99_08145 [Planctomycetota bacterium]|nr:hypothetical protein [Planctomycetota bacterium]